MRLGKPREAWKCLVCALKDCEVRRSAAGRVASGTQRGSGCRQCALDMTLISVPQRPDKVRDEGRLHALK
ncbi:hypothetical protein E2C01_047656 [Portunus trituberculatus]|uniref:Uncharacterized protein n=1 Tax=Portunus trituberculatus TaxID=210409 RepID=A0A5B7G865_PORTR|nr:hypothetical protein [Portunus trituberculatus]